MIRCTAKKRTRQCVKHEGHEGNHLLPQRHDCHWPRCDTQVPPYRWGCRFHWFMLPKILRNRLWATYIPGQEITKTPSSAYLRIAEEVQKWINENNKLTKMDIKS